MVTNSNGGESTDSPETTDAQNTTNGYNKEVEFGSDGLVGSAVPDDAGTNDVIEASNEPADNDVEKEDPALANSDEFEERIEEIVENDGGSVGLKSITYQLAHEFDEEPEDIDDALNTVASVKDGEVVGVASGVERAMDGDELTWEMVRVGYGCEPSVIGASDVTTQSDVEGWAREKCVEHLDESESWMYLVDKSQGIEEFYWYDSEKGIYIEDAKDDVGRLMDENLGRYSNTKEVNEVVRKLKTANKITSVDDVNAGDSPLRCVKNGVLNIETWELEDHSPHHRFTRRLNARWDPDVDTSRVEAYLRDITESERDAKVIGEMFGDVLVKHYRRQWFGMFYGEGANSKSLLMNCLRYTIGEENAASESLHDIADTRWSGAMMAGGTGALANIDPEIPADAIYDASEIKNNTGNDATSHERKGVDKFNAVNTAKMLFGMNGAAKFDEEKRAVVRRIKPIHLPYEYLPEEEVNEDDEYQKVRDQDLEDELTTEDSRAAWLLVMADGLRRLRDNGGFSYEQSQQELFDEYQAAADTFWNFQTNCLRNVRTTYNDTETPVYLTFNEIHSAYASYCHDLNETPMGEGEFAKELNKVGSLDIEKYYPADADGANSRKYLTFTDEGFKHAITSTLKRFELRVDEVDVPDMSPSSDGGNSGRDGGDTLLGKVTSAIIQLGNATTSGVSQARILNRVEDDIDDVSDLDAVLMKGVRKGEFEMTDDCKFTVISVDDVE